VSSSSRAPGRRFVAIACFRLRVEIARARELERAGRAGMGPLAVVIARTGGSIEGETSLLGNTRIDEVSPEAWALGVRPGSTIAAARARTADLDVRVVHAHAVDATLARLAEMGLGFGATVAFEAGAGGHDTVWIDITGCAHLLASELDPTGEATVARAVQQRVSALGHVARVAVADGPRVAAAIARHGQATSRAPIVVPPGAKASEAAMAKLPLRALPLGDASRNWLDKLGAKTVADVARLPREALGTRLGEEAAKVLPLVLGLDASPLTPYLAPEAPEERVEIEYGIEETTQLLFVAKSICDRMGARLAGRCLAATRLELVLELDRAMTSEGQDTRPVLALTLAAPLYQAADLLAVLRARIESYAIAAPVRAVVLRCADLVARACTPLDLLAPEPRADRVLPRLAAELAADLGTERVGILELVSSWVPENRTRLVPYRASPASPASPASASATKRRSRDAAPNLVSRTCEPTRVFATPLPHHLVPREKDGAKDGAKDGVPVQKSRRRIARLEAVEWWRRGREGDRAAAQEPAAQEPAVKEIVASWLEDIGAVAWIEIDRATNVARLRGWID
jgi:protein ImuB